MQTYNTAGARTLNRAYPAGGLISSPAPKKVKKQKAAKKRKPK